MQFRSESAKTLNKLLQILDIASLDKHKRQVSYAVQKSGAYTMRNLIASSILMCWKTEGMS